MTSHQGDDEDAPGAATYVVDLGGGGPEGPGRSGGLEDLMARLFGVARPVAVQRHAPGAYVAYLTGPRGRAGSPQLRVVGDHLTYDERVVRTIEAGIRRTGDEHARVMLVAQGAAGQTALDIAAMADSPLFEVDRVVTAGATTAVARVPRYTRMLCLEDRSDPVALLGSLVNAASDNRLTVVFDGTGAASVEERYVAGGRLADASTDPDLVAEINDLRSLGYLR